MPKETRFALVLNGGVSLAIWMGGVTHEVNRLRLASSGATARPPDADEAAVHDAWADILAATSRTAIVDVMAGTSAGGLNGTLLAKAVAGGTDLPYMRETWSSVAALEPDKLLGSTTSGARRSLLDGEFFRAEVEGLLQRLDASPGVVEPRDCTLLVTATAINAQPIVVDLEGSATATMTDSRRVYRFERSTDDADAVSDDFADCLPAMTWAARASASFPLAFEPVWETDDLRAQRVGSADAANSWLIDGGVLDNAPFGPLFAALQARPVGAEFERVVLYVTPSPGGAPAAPLGADPSATAVMGRVFGAAREPDQRLDLEHLQEAFREMGFTLAAPHEPLRRLLAGAIDLPAAAALAAAEAWLPVYRRTRAEAVERWLASLVGNPRLALANPPELDPDAVCSVPDGVAPGAGGEWQWGLATAERALRWWGRLLVDLRRDDVAVPNATFQRVERAQRMVARLWHELDQHMSDDGDSSLQQRSQRLNGFYLQQGKGAEIRAAMDETARLMAELSSAPDLDGARFLDLTLAVEVVSSVLSWGWTSEGDALRFRYGQVTPAVRSMVDIGEVVDSQHWPARKLYGERWGHFGAFASQQGRDADWLWGRLDGATALCDYLLESPDGEPLLPAAQAAELKEALVAAILTAEGTTVEGVHEAALTALNTEPGALLDHMAPADRQQALDILWSQAVRVLDEVNPQAAPDPGLTAPLVARAFADPTWSKHDRPAGLGWKDRMTLRLVRIYGWPARWQGRKRLRKALRL